MEEQPAEPEPRATKRERRPESTPGGAGPAIAWRQRNHGQVGEGACEIAEVEQGRSCGGGCEDEKENQQQQQKKNKKKKKMDEKKEKINTSETYTKNIVYREVLTKQVMQFLVACAILCDGSWYQVFAHSQRFDGVGFLIVPQPASLFFFFPFLQTVMNRIFQF